jgi:hypothetical protein
MAWQHLQLQQFNFTILTIHFFIIIPTFRRCIKLAVESTVKQTKVKVMMFLCTPWKIWGRGGADPFFLNLGIRWLWVISVTLRPLYPWEKSSRYPFETGWAWQTVQTLWRRYTFLVPVGNQSMNPQESNPYLCHNTDYFILGLLMNREWINAYILVRYSTNFNFLDTLSKNAQISNFIKIRQWQDSCSTRTDRPTWRS